MKLTSTKDKALSFVRCLVHGDSGIGKTTSLGTLPEDRTLIVCAERGLLPLAGKDYAVVQVESWAQLMDVTTLLQAKDGIVPGRNITVIAFDSLTDIVELAKTHILEIDRKPLMLDRSKGESDKPFGIYADSLTTEDWGLLSRRLGHLLGCICHLPFHVVATALTTWVENKMSGEIKKAPDCGSKASCLEVAAYFDVVVSMESATDEKGRASRIFRTATNGQSIAKDASGKLSEFEPTDWTKLLTKVIGNGQVKRAK